MCTVQFFKLPVCVWMVSPFPDSTQLVTSSNISRTLAHLTDFAPPSPSPSISNQSRSPGGVRASTRPLDRCLSPTNASTSSSEPCEIRYWLLYRLLRAFKSIKSLLSPIMTVPLRMGFFISAIRAATFFSLPGPASPAVISLEQQSQHVQ